MPDVNSLTFITRTNTVCIDVKEVHGGPKVPKGDWLNFLKDDMKLKPDQVVECNIHSLTDLLMVKLNSEELFEEIKERLRLGVPWSEKGGALVFGWSVHEALTSVRIINVSTHLDQAKIVKKMSDYGKVISVREGVHAEWPGSQH